MILYKCDLCGEIRECSQREIEHLEYDLCAECWNALAAKLKGKGRARGRRETVVLPAPPAIEPAPPAKPPHPGKPPDIFGTDQVN